MPPRIEASQAAQLESFARVVAARIPASGAASASIAGGCAAFLAPHITPSRAAGLGMNGPVSAEDVEALIRFYRDRDTEARILVSPYADPSLFEQLGERGFRLVDFDTVLVRRVDPADRFPDAPAGVAVRQAAIADAAAWVSTSLEGFAPPGQAPDLDHAPVFEASFHDPSLAFFLATASGLLAGTAGFHVHGTAAFFFADSTLPAFRGRGVQAALIAARLARARDAGCDLAFAATAPGSVSQRSYERAGFAPACSQALLVAP